MLPENMDNKDKMNPPSSKDMSPDSDQGKYPQRPRASIPWRSITAAQAAQASQATRASQAFQSSSAITKQPLPLPRHGPAKQLESLQSLTRGASTRNDRDSHDDRNFAASYFAGAQSALRHMDEKDTIVQPVVAAFRPVNLVTFKCNRAELFFSPDDPSIKLSPGDMVIVEGDRGDDLGTVQEVNISMTDGKKLKADFTKRHFRTLMVFSRQFPHVAAQMDAAEARGDPAPARAEADPRPRMIKRIARQDEVFSLRDKEGNEAKAKRFAQAKANDHGYPMEVLDAEFQL
jgi:hypothetical protein